MLEEHYLGVIVDEHLKFSTHVTKAVASASSSLGLVKRTISSCSPKTVSFLYKALVWPRLETCMVLASPFFTKDVKIPEDVKRRATKMVSGLHELPYPKRLRKQKLPTPAYRRRLGDAQSARYLIRFKINKELLLAVVHFNSQSKSKGKGRNNLN